MCLQKRPRDNPFFAEPPLDTIRGSPVDPSWLDVVPCSDSDSQRLDLSLSSGFSVDSPECGDGGAGPVAGPPSLIGECVSVHDVRV